MFSFMERFDAQGSHAFLQFLSQKTKKKWNVWSKGWAEPYTGICFQKGWKFCFFTLSSRNCGIVLFTGALLRIHVLLGWRKTSHSTKLSLCEESSLVPLHCASVISKRGDKHFLYIHLCEPLKANMAMLLTASMSSAKDMLFPPSQCQKMSRSGATKLLLIFQCIFLIERGGIKDIPRV